MSCWNIPLTPTQLFNHYAFQPPKPSYSITNSENGYTFLLERPDIAEILPVNYGDQLVPFIIAIDSHRSIACLMVLCKVTKSVAPYPARATILFSHGNATDIGEMLPFILKLCHRLHVNILCYDYAGYGASTSNPTEHKLTNDITYVIEALENRFFISSERVVLFGQSIGTVPTISLASKIPVAAIVVQSGMVSGMSLIWGNRHKPYYYDVINNLDAIAKVPVATLIIHGTHDKVVDCSHGKDLYDRLQKPLEPLFLLGAGHSDCATFPAYIIRLQRLINQDVPQAIARSSAWWGLSDNPNSTSSSPMSLVTSDPSALWSTESNHRHTSSTLQKIPSASIFQNFVTRTFSWRTRKSSSFEGIELFDGKICSRFPHDKLFPLSESEDTATESYHVDLYIKK